MNLFHKLFSLVAVVLTLLICVGGMGVYKSKQLSKGIYLEGNRVHENNELALLTQVHFKKQVQEWKNVLLRGHVQEDYKKYFGLFEREERIVREKINLLIGQLEENSATFVIANNFLTSHILLGELYRDALSRVNKSDSTSIFYADSYVRGIDREPTNLIDSLVVEVKLQGNRKKVLLESQQRKIELIAIAAIFLFVVIACLTMLYLLHIWVSKPVLSAIRFATEIAKGNLDHDLESQSSGDIGRLVEALNSMRASLKSSYQQLLETNSDLEKKRDEALTATKLKTEFLANMSHEIRTPMNGIIGMAEILSKTRLDDEQIRLASTIQESSDALLNLINDILDISIIESGKLRLKPQDFILENVLNDCILELHSKAEEKDLDCVLFLDEKLPQQVYGDPWRFRQIITNLLNNAIKFTDQGGVSLICQQIALDEGEHRISVTVADTGIGISKEKQHAIFAAFSQVDASYQRNYGGVGLGLAICSKLARVMGGEINVQSQEGNGSEFQAVLPFNSVGEIKGDASFRAGVNGFKSILILSDRKLFSQSLQLMLTTITAASITTKSAYNFKKTVNGALQYDCIFVDDRLLIEDGEQYSAIEEYKENGSAIIEVRSSKYIGLDSSAREMPIFSAHIYRPVIRKTLKKLMRNLEVPAHAEEIQGDSIASALSVDCQRVLIVEDNHVNQMILKTVLEKEGYDVDLVENGQESIELVFKRDYDCILMDCQMPVMDGYTATETIRKKEMECADGSHRFIIALTAHAMTGDREKCLNAGMDEYLTKPIKPQIFLPKLKKMISSHKKVTL